MRFSFFLRIFLMILCFSSVASAQKFAFGASLTGVGDFGNGLFSTEFPGTIGASARVEWLDSFAKGLSVRADVGTKGLEAGLVWRLDLSANVNATIHFGFVWLEWQKTGLVGRFGLEYQFSNFAIALEYGWLSPFIGTPNIRSSWLLSILWFVTIK
jgi:hypothetical protein